MKAALLGDVHANLPALEAVLEHAGGRRVEAVWNVGDWVGYGAYPDAVVRRLRREGAVSIVGNYDLKVLRFPAKKRAWRQRKRPEKYLAFRWAFEKLSPESRAYLAGLPREVRLEVEGRSILLTHGSPASIDEHLYPDTSEERLQELAAMAAADIVVTGHSHVPFAREAAGVRFVNPGSVGRQDDGDPRASYAILELDEAEDRVRHYRLEYDIERAVEEIRRHGLPVAFAEMMRRGHKLDWVLDRHPSAG